MCCDAATHTSTYVPMYLDLRSSLGARKINSVQDKEADHTQSIYNFLVYAQEHC